jgi:hypothetical protein
MPGFGSHNQMLEKQKDIQAVVASLIPEAGS